MTGQLARIRANAATQGFDASSTEKVGALLRALAASKPGGLFLELGTGAGLGTAFILEGMNAEARLVTVELDPQLSQLAQQEIDDPRVKWVIGDGGDWLIHADGRQGFDLVFADTWPGKFTHLDEALDLVAPGGWYLIDDLSPQANWPDRHQTKVDDLVAHLQAQSGWQMCQLDWASGVMLCVRAH